MTEVEVGIEMKEESAVFLGNDFQDAQVSVNQVIPSREFANSNFDAPREIEIVAVQERKDISPCNRKSLIDGVIHAVVWLTDPPKTVARTERPNQVKRPISGASINHDVLHSWISLPGDRLQAGSDGRDPI